MINLLHAYDDEQGEREGYVYSAGGVGVPEYLVRAVLDGWAAISPTGDPASPLQYVNQGALNRVDNLARITVEAVLRALADQRKAAIMRAADTTGADHA